MNIAEIIAAFSQAVSLFKVLLSQQATAKKLSAAVKNLGTVLGTEALVIDGSEVTAVELGEIAKFFDGLVTGEDAMRIQLTKQASFVEVALEAGELVPDDSVDIAKAALAEWAEVNTAPKALKVLRAS